MKDRSHYGLLVRDVVLDVTPEQAGVWLNTRPPAPIMWSRGAANNEKAERLAGLMRLGEWDNDLPVEPVMISENHGFILGGHHRLTAVTKLGRPLALRVLFWEKPKGWDKLSGDERRELQKPTLTCPDCGWWSQIPEAMEGHLARAHAWV